MMNIVCAKGGQVAPLRNYSTSVRSFMNKRCSCTKLAIHKEAAPNFCQKRLFQVYVYKITDSSKSTFLFHQPGKSLQRIFNHLPRARMMATNSQAKGDEQITHSLPLGDKVVAYWLLTVGALVFLIIIVGGVTRLTESGLSITEWKPVVGAMPPTTQEEWEEEFRKYKMSPELNFGMTLEEYKRIYWMEWAHRELGRFIGLAFGVPFVAFAAKGWIRGKMLAKCSGLLGLLGLQGLIGWYMVKSGLDAKNFEESRSVPRVSQYRLALHLSSALVLYTSVLWLAQNILNPVPHPKLPSTVPIRTIRMAGLGATGMVGLTAFSGAFVAGLDAGLVYNTFPLMAEQWIPDDILRMNPLWKNFFENETTVQFDHRVLGISTLAAVYGLYGVAMKHRAALPPRTRMAFNAMFAVANLQVALGISTLLSFVPTHLAASHQAGAVTLLSTAVWMLHQVRRIPI